MFGVATWKQLGEDGANQVAMDDRIRGGLLEEAVDGANFPGREMRLFGQLKVGKNEGAG